MRQILMILNKLSVLVRVVLRVYGYLFVSIVLRMNNHFTRKIALRGANRAYS